MSFLHIFNRYLLSQLMNLYFTSHWNQKIDHLYQNIYFQTHQKTYYISILKSLLVKSSFYVSKMREQINLLHNVIFVIGVVINYFTKCMATLTQKISMNTEITDDSSSLQSSRRSYKRIQRSTSRNSARSSSKESDTETLKNFYVKNISVQDILRKNTHNQKEGEAKKKRDPTPCKSRKLIPNTKNTVAQSEAIKLKNLQNTIIITDMEEKIRKKGVQICKLKNENKNQQQQIKNLNNLLIQQQNKNAELIAKNNTNEEKIAKLQQTIVKSQANLATAKNSLQKIKKTIQQIRVNDLRKENEAYRIRIDKLTQENMTIKETLYAKDKLLQQLDSQVKVLRNKIDFQLSIRNQSAKEIFLQNQVSRLKELLQNSHSSISSQFFQTLQIYEYEKICLKNEVQKLNIQLNYIQRKHVEQIKLYARIKTQELLKMKCKYKKLLKEYENKKKQWEEQRRFNTHSQLSSEQPRTMCRAVKDNTIYKLMFEGRSRKYSETLELSPDEHEHS